MTLPMAPATPLDVTYPRTGSKRDTAPVAEARGTRDVAVMFADIAGSTGLYEMLGDARAQRVVAAILQLMTNAAQSCGGRLVKTIGDAVLCAFPSADDGARGSTAVQQALLELQVPDAERVAVRVGFNYGPAVEVGGDVFGDSVNVAARLAEMARPHQILTTETCVERLSAAHRSKAHELQLIGVRGRDNYVPVWELRWRAEEDSTQRLVLPARPASKGIVLRLEFRGRSWELGREGDTLAMGRDDTSKVLLDGQLASRYHARIQVRNRKFILIDHSSNGTYVLPAGGEAVAVMHEEYTLSGSGEIGFGRVPADAGDELVRFAAGERSQPRAAGRDDAAAAGRAGKA